MADKVIKGSVQISNSTGTSVATIFTAINSEIEELHIEDIHYIKAPEIEIDTNSLCLSGTLLGYDNKLKLGDSEGNPFVLTNASESVYTNNTLAYDGNILYKTAYHHEGGNYGLVSTYGLKFPETTNWATDKTIATLDDIQTISGGENYVQTGSAASNINQFIYGKKIFADQSIELQGAIYPTGYQAPTNSLTNDVVGAAIGRYGISIGCSDGSNNKQYSWPTSSGTLAVITDIPTGTAAAKNYTTSVTSGSSDLVTSGAVYTVVGNIESTLNAIINGN